jgi:hypothetical protein
VSTGNELNSIGSDILKENEVFPIWMLSPLHVVYTQQIFWMWGHRVSR